MNDEILLTGSNLGELYARCAGRFPDRVALVAGDRRISYRDMYRQSLQIVSLLRAQGLKRGDALAILAGNVPEVVMMIVAAQILGLRFTALHPMGSLQDHAFILEDAQISALFVDSADFGERGNLLLDSVSSVNVFLSIGEHDKAIDVVTALSDYEPAKPDNAVSAHDITLVAYTGGTTGRPKGVIHTHRSILNMIKIELAEWEWPESPVFLAVAPVSHAVGGMLLPTFLRGGTFVLERSFNPGSFFEIVERESVSATFLVPTMIYVLLDHFEVDRYDLSSLQMIIYGAAPIQTHKLQQALEIFGSIFCQIYGQVEAPNALTYLRKSDHDLRVDGRLASCGMPVTGVDVRLMDDEMREVATGEVGEICARGPHLMQGYWQRKPETQSALGDGWLRTGDLARRDENGFLYIVDRRKDMVISGGFNVYPSEVEAVIAGHPSVDLCAVIGLPHATWGEVVTGVVCLKRGETCSAEELIALVKEKKGSVQAPKNIVFVESLPLTPLGKIDKKSVRESFRDHEFSRD